MINARHRRHHRHGITTLINVAVITTGAITIEVVVVALIAALVAVVVAEVAAPIETIGTNHHRRHHHHGAVPLPTSVRVVERADGEQLNLM